ncbi:MAG: nitroreductase [Flavobacteriales bacterium]|jgi:nitroreductase|nr:nitroreductase [Flavobacteriales bacterium]
MRYNISEIRAVIEDRRTIIPEHFSTRKVHKEIVMELLDAAKWAPTHRYTQPWHFKVFMGDGLKKLSDFQSELYMQKMADDFNQEKYDKLRDRPLMTTAIIGICMKRDEAERDPIEEEIASVSMAVQNMMLVAAAHGIGAFWMSGGITYWPETKDFMTLGEKDKFLGFLYLGYPKEDWPRKTRRKPQEYFTQWIEG